MKPLYITRLTVEDFLGIELLKIDGVGKTTKFSGDQGTGKTSALTAVEALFRSTGRDVSFIRHGADKAKIIVEMNGGEVTCERTISAKGNTPKVTVNGEPVSKAQTFLDELYKLPYIFRPLDFLDGDKRSRRSLLLQAIPVLIDRDWMGEKLADIAAEIDLDRFDFTRHGLDLIGEIQRHVYDRRTEVNRDRDRLAKAIEQGKKDLPESLDLDRFGSYDAARRREDLAAAEKLIAQHQADLRLRDSMRQQNKAIGDEISAIDDQILKLQQRKIELEAKQDRLVEEGQALSAKIEQFQQPDVTAIRVELGEYDRFRDHKSSLELVRSHERQLVEKDAVWTALDETYKALVDDIPREILAGMKMPVPGVELRGDDIYVDGVPLDKRSRTEQLGFILSLAKELADRMEAPLRVLILDNFESCGSELCTELARAQEADGWQYLIAEVCRGKKRLEYEKAGKVF